MVAKRSPGPLVGNDVVDLADPRCPGKAADRRFVERVFAPEEAGAIETSADPDRVLWLNWAAKEAAFKVISKLLDDPPVFRHASFVFRAARPQSPTGAPGSVTSGTVSYGSTEVAVRIEAGPERFHALARCPGSHRWGSIGAEVSLFRRSIPDSGVDWMRSLRHRFTEREWRSIHRPESALVRIHAREHLSRSLGLPPDAVEIVSEEGPPGRMPPRVLIRGRPWEGDVSLSHHGRFLAWACTPPPRRVSASHRPDTSDP